MKRSSKRSSKRCLFVVVVVTLLAAAGTSLYTQAQTQDQPPSPARSRSDEMLHRWNEIGNKLVAGFSPTAEFWHPLPAGSACISAGRATKINITLVASPGPRSVVLAILRQRSHASRDGYSTESDVRPLTTQLLRSGCLGEFACGPQRRSKSQLHIREPQHLLHLASG